MNRLPDEAMTSRASFLFACAGHVKLRDLLPARRLVRVFSLVVALQTPSEFTSHAGVIAVDPVPHAEGDAERYQRLIGARWKMRRNDLQGGKIVFGAVFVENPQRPGVHHNVQVNFYGGSRYFDDNDCSNYWPPHLPRLIDSNLPSLSVGTVDYFHEYTPWAGVRSSDTRLFPRYTAWQDGNPKFPKIDTFGQFDVRGHDSEVEVRRGDTFRGDLDGWGMDCVASLPADELFRVWLVRVRIAQRLFGWQIAVPEREGNRLRAVTPMNFLTEFFELPGLVQVYLWDLEFLDGWTQEWFSLPVWKVSYRIQDSPSIPSQGWGARVAGYGTNRVLELSNDRSESYSQQVGEVLDLTADPLAEPGPWLRFVQAETNVVATARTVECVALLSTRAPHDVRLRIRNSGSAVPGLDYVDNISTQTWVLPAGSGSIRVPVELLGMAEPSGGKTLVLTLDEISGARVGEVSSWRLEMGHPDWPGAVGGLRPPGLTRMAGITCSLMALEWSEGGAGGDPWTVAGYRLFRDGNPVAFIRWPERSYHDLVLPGSHRYEIATVGPDGEESPRSPPQTVWTPSCPTDVESPVANLDIPLLSAAAGKVAVRGMVMDDIGASEVFLEINGQRSPQVAETRVSSTNQLQVAVSFDLTYDELKLATNELVLVCADASGKTTRSGPREVVLVTEVAAALTLVRTDEGGFLLSWPEPAEGHVLESTDLGPEFGLWERVPGPALPTHSNWVVGINPAAIGRWFRLRAE